MLIRRLRRCGFDASCNVVSLEHPDHAGVIERVCSVEELTAAPTTAYAEQFTHVVRIREGGKWLHFLADVIEVSETTNYMSTADAARILGVKDRTVRRWAECGKLEAVRTAGGEKRQGSWLVSVASVDALAPESQDLEPGPQAKLVVAPTPRKRPEMPGQMDMLGE